jgi:hypothetical protein
MRTAALALVLAAAPAAAQELTAEKIVGELQARAPRFKDADLRYVARVSVEDEVEFGGETRVVVVAGAGVRTEASVLALRSRDRSFQELDLDVASAETGDALYFWAAVHRGPAELSAVLPPGVSLKGNRGDYRASLDAFPADFPFRWVYDDPLALSALAPREAFARDPGLVARGRHVADGKTYLVLEVPLPHDRSPAESVLRSLPIGAPAKRFFVEADAWRLAAIDLRFEVDNRTFVARWDVRSRRDFAGGSVPETVELSMANEKNGRVLDDLVRLTKRLSFAASDRGLGESDLVPEDRRKDLHAEGPLKSAAFYTAAIEKDPRAAAAYAGRALARYRDALLAAIRGPDPRIDAAATVADFEKAQRLAPASPFVNLALLRLYDGPAKTALAQALEGQPIRSPDLTLALAAFWAGAGDADRALKHLGALEVSATAPLRWRLGAARARIGVRAGEGGKALAELFRDASAGERPLLLDALAPIPLRRAAGGAENKALQAAIEAALAANAGLPELQELRLRAAMTGDDDRFTKALEAFADAVKDPDALDHAARLALQAGADPAARASFKARLGAAEKMAGKAPRAATVALLHGVALLDSGEKARGLSRLEEALGGLEKEVHAGTPPWVEVLTPLARAFAEAERDEALVRTCRLFVSVVNRSAKPYRLLRGAQDPLGLCVGSLVKKERFADAFRAIRDLDRQKIMFLHSLRPALRSSEPAFIKAAREHVFQTSKDPADYRKLASLLQTLFGRPEEAAAVLEKARELAPGDVELTHEYAAVCYAARDTERAVRAYEEVLAGLDKAPSAKIDRNLVLFNIAQLHGRAGRFEKAAGALDRLDLAAASLVPYLSAVGQLYEQAGAVEKAIGAYRKFLDAASNAYAAVTSGVFARLGRLYEKRDEIEEAYRVYSRGMKAVQEAKAKYGEAVVARPRLGPDGKRVENDADPAALRAALLKRVGEDYFIRKMLEKPAGPLGADAERRVKELYEKLRSDSIVERDEAALELRKIGPAAAPLLKPGLESGDAEFRARVRQILAEWAEPR